MFAVEPSFSRVDIQGCTNLPQNWKTIHNEDINNTSKYWQQYIVAVLFVRYTTLASTSVLGTIDVIDGSNILFCLRYCIV
jgi:hypothetical protein